MKVDARVALENAAHEALIRQAYKDSVGVWTWSVGLTSATGHRVDRYINNPQPIQRCIDIYLWALENYADHVRDVFKDRPLTQAEFAAVLSFTWNLGGGALRRATWVQHFKAGNMAVAEATFKSWNLAGGKVSQGLVNRRQKEADLLFRGIWSNKGTITEFTRLRADFTPDFSSGRLVDITKELEKAFWSVPPVLDQLPQPDKDQAPTLSPDVDLVFHNFFTQVLDWLKRWWRGT